MRVLITGGAGFIGSHLCDMLVAGGDEVTVLDNLSTGTSGNLFHLNNKVNMYQGDIRDQNLVDFLVKETDIVLHMAAAVGVKNILENPLDSISTNYIGSEVIMNACLSFGKRIIIASTSEIYGKNPNQPLSENDDRVLGAPQKLRWSYADAKALEEATAYALFLTKGLKVTTVRFFNTVGPRQTGKYGMVIPRFVKAALENEPLKVYGTGLQTRVFCHVLDSIQAIKLLISSENTFGEAFNVGGKNEISILALAQLVLEITNSKSRIEFVPYNEAYPPGFEEILKRVPNISKINSYTGWEPKIEMSRIILDVAKG